LIRFVKYVFPFIILTAMLILAVGSDAATNPPVKPARPAFIPNTQTPDTSKPVYPIPADQGNPYQQLDDQSPFYLKDPPNIKRDIVYDPVTGQYTFVSKVGDFQYREPVSMSMSEYRNFDNKKGIRAYWKERTKAAGTQTSSSIIPAIYIGGEAFDRIFGGNTIDIRPQGSAEVTFGVRSVNREDPQLDVRQRRTTNFDFQQKIQMNVIAKIGDKIEFKTNYNTEATFQFENKLQLKYEGKEDEIIKLIEAGNVSMPLNTTLISGSQSLFGIKTKMQFGRTTVTTVFSQQESESKNITVQGGAQTNKFNLSSLDYEENRHFFVSQYFRDKFESSLTTLPIVSSDINITKIEVWVTNIGAAVDENRNIVAFTDLGEGKQEWIYNKEIQPKIGPPLPTNRSNNLIARLDTASIRSINTVTAYLTGDPFKVGKNSYMVPGQDFEKVENARKLSPSEFSFNSKLGFISLNTTLNSDQTLAVAYQYTVIGYDSTFQVGEFSDQGINTPKCLTAKLLKSTSINTRMPMWNLMMKNVYSIRAFQVNKDDFTFNILYKGNQNGVPTGYFTEGNDDVKGIPLVHLMNLDNLNQQLNPIQGGDGVFDFIDNAASNGGTINSNNGRIYFTVLEPFGSHLRNKVFPDDPDLANKYAFDSLYTLTKSGAEQFPDKNKFILEGFYKSQAGSEINLNALNVPQGSVRVTAGGVPLAENVDYTVDYTLGRVRIINEGIMSSGQPINISLESNTMFSIQQKRMMGLRVDHEINKDFKIGGTLLNLHERPLTQKVNYGDDPISNTIYGLDLSYRTQSRWLTKMIDKIPGISTKEVSRINFDGEFAQFLPGHAKAVGKTGTSYIDDFEGAKSTIDLRQPNTWFLASTPQGQLDLFPEASSGTGLAYGKNRSKLAWYIIDPLFYDRYGTLRPPNVDKNELARHSVRQVLETEVFPNKQLPSGIPTNIAVLNLAYYPSERGPYNYDVMPSTFSQGMNAFGLLERPDTRWGGIMRRIESTDFEATNIEYIEFWMMDPFTEDPNNPGELYINLGDVSEDILRDGRKFYENGLPVSEAVENVDTTIWGRVPTLQALVESFSSLPGSRQFQDVGYDGLRDIDERSFQEPDFLDIIRTQFGAESDAYKLANEDPSADNFQYFRGSKLDSDSRYGSILERYKNFNGPDGNSPTDDLNPEAYPTSATSMPNVEDINRDNTLSEAERYFQYRIKLDPNKMYIGENYITDIQDATGIDLGNGSTGEVKWYQFKIPVSQPERVVGNIEDFRSIRFIRMFFKGFEKPIVARFATLELVRGEWRKYRYNLESAGEYVVDDHANNTRFDISAVNIEENGRREPIPYVEPPGIEREINYGTTSLVQLNEQSMQFTVESLQDGDARAAFKTTDFDFRKYKKLKMYVHAEKLLESEDMEYGDLTVFIRLGSDFTENYYEYEIPVKFTPWGTSYIDREGIWPDVNRFDIDLEALVAIKQNRNIAMRDPNSDISLMYPYIEYIGDHKVKVLGSPSISDINGIMIGVRNPKRLSLNTSDDGNPKSAVIWVNELRVTDFDNKGGWGATARMETMLADIGRVVVSGAHSSPGFGSLDMKVNETSREAKTSFDVATDIDLGKFLPAKTGLKVPMHFDYGESHIKPEYNPLDPDIKLNDDLDSYQSKDSQDSLKRIVKDYTQRKNINFINVRKDRVDSKRPPRIYDVENLSVSYAYSEIYHRNIDLDFDLRKTYRGGIGYTFNNNPKNIQPFSKLKWASKPAFQLIKDFNFYYLPKNFSFRTDMNRTNNTKKFRNKSAGDIITYPIYAKTWTWNRNYDFKFDFTKALTFDFTAGTNAYIYEPAGNPDRGTTAYNQNRDTIMDEIFRFGSKSSYSQTFKLNYTVPLNKIPVLNWISATAGYQGMYTWTASPLSVQDRIGNTLGNQNTKQLNGNVDLVKLYNKNTYLKNLNTPPKAARGSGPTPRSIDEKQGAVKPATPNPEEALADSTGQKPRVNYAKIVGDQLLKLTMSIKKASLNYTQNNGILLPGFMPEPDLLGYNFNSGAPGWGFVLGSEADIRQNAVANGWLSGDSLLNQAYSRRYTENLAYKVNLEPVSGLRIDISGDKTRGLNFQEFFRADSTGTFRSFSPTESGNFSMSFGMWNTAFVKPRKDDSSELFDKMLDNRKIIADRLAYKNQQWIDEGENYYYDSAGANYFPYGYGSQAQEVLFYSFIAAYRGQDAKTIKMNPFPKIPIPNWSISYNGLSKIEALKGTFKNINLTHAYRSSYAITTWRSNVDFDPENLTKTYANTNLFITRYDLSQITLTEQFSPLLGLDLAFHNSLTARVEYKKQRNLTMSFVNNQLTEVAGSEIVIGSGYRIKNLSLILSSVTGGGRATRSSNDLVLKVDLGFRTDKTTLRRIDENNSQVSAGQNRINIYVTADYMINDRFNLQAFFKRDMSDPFVSSQFKNSNTFAGITMRFNLAQ